MLHTFTGGADGAIPQGGLVRDSEGNLYGVTSEGGDLSACDGLGCGVVFKVDPAGNQSVLYTFSGGSDGSTPAAGLIRDAEGNLYGTTALGGAYGSGAVFHLNPTGQETVLYSFQGAAGSYPSGSLLLGPSGMIWGTARFGGSRGYGTLFVLGPGGNEKVLHDFINGSDGDGPQAGLLAFGGALYGTTFYGGSGHGTVFKLALH